MAIETDVLVIGGGVAGATAALAGAREDPAADVTLVSAKESTLRYASGLIDVLGYADDDGPLADPFAAFERLPDEHPYSLVGPDAVREALDLFDAVAGDAYAGGHTDANALVPTVAGTVKPTARYPASVAPGLVSDPRPTLLVGFETLPAFDAPMAAATLAETVSVDVRGVTVRFPGDPPADAAATRYANALERDDPVWDSNGPRRERESIRDALAARVSAHLAGEERVGFPAVLGEGRPAAVRTALADRLGADVFEVPGATPNIPGTRLESLLYDALRDAGVEVATGVPVVGAETTGARGGANASVGANGGESGGPPAVERALVDRDGRTIPYRADTYVLATGGLVGQGVESDRETVREPIFDCHVAHPDDRTEWVRRDPFDDHPFARFGVRVDRSLRPLSAAGDPEYANLRAAGAVLAGADTAAECSGAGVSLATGYVAGRRAAAEVSA